MKTYIRCMTALVIFWLVLMCCVVASIGASAETMYVDVKAGTHLNGRERPKKGTDILCYFERGDAVNVIDVKNGWAKLDEGGEASNCWVSLDYLTADLSGRVEMTVGSNGRVRVRDDPNGKVVGYVNDGDVVSVAVIFEGWARTDKGWISSDYLY